MTEWMFEGVNSYSWPINCEWWGFAIDAGGPEPETRMFLPGVFLPASMPLGSVAGFPVIGAQELLRSGRLPP